MCGEFEMCVCGCVWVGRWETKKSVQQQPKKDKIARGSELDQTLACLLYPWIHAAVFILHKQTGSYMLN